jgi:hypothetical protein
MIPTERWLRRGLLIGIALYLILVAIGSGYVLLQLWPAQIGTTQAPVSAGNATVSFWLTPWTFRVSEEVRIIGLVLSAGAIGAVTSGLYAEFLHIAHDDFNSRWTLWYLARPFIGAFFGLIFYLALRAGLFSIGSSVTQLNVFGFTALAAIVGMFEEETLLKFRQIAESVLTTKSSPVGEYPSGKKVPVNGRYVFLDHLAGSTCVLPHTDAVQNLNEGDFFPNCPSNSPCVWKRVGPQRR